MRLGTDMGLKEVQEYATKLKKVEKMKELREQVYRPAATPLQLVCSILNTIAL